MPDQTEQPQAGGEPRTRPLPPGPKSWPLVGNLLQIDFEKGLPTWLLKLQPEFGDIFCYDIARIHITGLCHPEHVRHILMERPDLFYKGPFFDQFRLLAGEGLLSSDGELWRRQRKLAAPAFHHQKISSMARGMSLEVDQLISGWRDGQALDIYQEMVQLTLRIVGRALFGQDLSSVGPDSSQALTAALEEISERSRSPLAAPMWIPTRANRRLKNALRQLDDLIYHIVKNHRDAGNGGDDLLSMFVSAVDEDDGSGMDDKQLRDEVVTLFLAGHETTAVVLAWIFWELAQHPEIVARLEQEVDQVLGGRSPGFEDYPQLTYTRQVLEEGLRKHSPVVGLLRDVREDTTIDGYFIPAGSLVVVAPRVIHRHPQFWPDPETFDPERFTPDLVRTRHKMAYIPFGAGPRICIGNTFALVEGVLVLAGICQRWRFHMEAGMDPGVQHLVTSRPARGVPGHITRRF